LEGIYILNHTGISYTIMHFTANLADEEEWWFSGVQWWEGSYSLTQNLTPISTGPPQHAAQDSTVFHILHILNIPDASRNPVIVSVPLQQWNKLDYIKHTIKMKTASKSTVWGSHSTGYEKKQLKLSLCPYAMKTYGRVKA
jgi:hypothetical protein